MDPAYLIPFISSIQNVFSTMLQLPVTIGDPSVKSEPATNFDISGIIGMSGDVVGNIVLSFPEATATGVVGLFTGTKMAVADPDFADAIGELVNMVCGGAKGQFSGSKKVSISCPSVVMGTNHSIARQKDTPCVVIPCTTDCGEFVIEIAIKEANNTSNASAATATANA
ncbi:MAG: chemotaxis protein CheX [Pyrinomonadaceae bacterium]|nr:chemotaxis protein CheX [Phycisphaerales bacterium]